MEGIKLERDVQFSVWQGLKLAALIVVCIYLTTVGADLISRQSGTAVMLGASILLGTLAVGLVLMVRIGLNVARYFKFIAVLLAIACIQGCIGCTKVPPGYEGIRIKMYGKFRGVQDLPIVTGRVWYNPWTEEIEVFPTFLQTYTWNATEHRDESITFTSLEGSVVNADVSVAFTYQADKVPSIYLAFRQDPDVIAETYVRARVRDAFVHEGPRLKIMDIVGARNGDLTAAVKKRLDGELIEKGILLDYVSIGGRPRIPPEIAESITRAIQQTQDAITAQNKVAQIEAEARQRVAEADGIAKAKIATAQGEATAAIEAARGDAQSTLLKADAQAKANTQLAISITPKLNQYRAIQTWDGKLPQYMTGQAPIPFLNMSPEKEKD
ncbi:MAG: SPFH domain-containing protein [Candidatus Binatus sp.]|uniref:SPFH domain-containing protein n=1 Tax=Candidatus Binatus sp. TaxID=2811406 RepID=UPI0027249672|nr:SPFH domain-containing protein [Candidatus Binatus sp.]MDO8431918.1 SPFH domain-containing protein [Candidatus Binatus sp.]